MDVGCGDGHVTMDAYDMMGDDATIYAVDVYEPSIEDLKKDLKKDGITNIIPLQANVADKIAVDDEVVDICLMINVFHHFVGTQTVPEAIRELKRITKPGGKIAVMDYKKEDTGYGPPVRIKRTPEEVEEMFSEQGLKRVKLDTEVGETLKNGAKSHYLIIFEK